MNRKNLTLAEYRLELKKINKELKSMESSYNDAKRQNDYAKEDQKHYYKLLKQRKKTRVLTAVCVVASVVSLLTSFAFVPSQPLIFAIAGLANATLLCGSGFAFKNENRLVKEYYNKYYEAIREYNQSLTKMNESQSKLDKLKEKRKQYSLEYIVLGKSIQENKEREMIRAQAQKEYKYTEIVR